MKHHKRKKILFISLLTFLVGILVISPFGAKEAQAVFPLLLVPVIAKWVLITGGIGWAWFGAPGLGTLLNATAIPVYDSIAGILFKIGTWLALQSAALFDIVIDISLVSDLFMSDGVRAGWEVMRDLANIGFIFILVYISFATILQVGKIGTKKVLASLVVVALLVNFSFFLTGVVIDSSNILARVFHNELAPIETNVKTQVEFRRPIAMNLIKNNLNIESLIKGIDRLDKSNQFVTGTAKLMSAMIVFIIAFTFLSGAILFLSRLLVLIFLIILSPLAFAASVLPSTRKYWSTWLGKLIGTAFVAPIFLLLLLIVFKILAMQGEVTGGIELMAAVDISKPQFEKAGIVFINLAIVIGFLLGITKVTKAVAGEITDFSTKWAGKIVGAGLGVGAFGLRRTAGQIGRFVSKSKFLKDKDAEGGMSGFAARLALKSAGRVSKTSFDPRAGKIGKVTGILAGVVSTDFGKADGKGGYEAIREAQIKKQIDYAEFIGKGEGGLERQEELSKRLAKGSILSHLIGRDVIEKEAAKKIQKDIKKKRAKKESPKIKKEMRQIEQEITTLEKEVKDTQPTPPRQAQIDQRISQLKAERSKKDDQLADLESVSDEFRDMEKRLAEKIEKSKE